MLVTNGLVGLPQRAWLDDPAPIHVDGVVYYHHPYTSLHPFLYLHLLPTGHRAAATVCRPISEVGVGRRSKETRRPVSPDARDERPASTTTWFCAVASQGHSPPHYVQKVTKKV